MKELRLNSTDVNYNQSYQNQQVTFSFLKEITNNCYEEMFKPVLCRDYLSDCVAARLIDEPVGYIYGFSFDKKLENKTLLSVAGTSKSFVSGLAVIRKLEKNFKNLQCPLKVHKTQHKDIFIIEADPVWSTNSLTISLLTFILRVINYHRSKNFRNLDNLFKDLVEVQDIPGDDGVYLRRLSKVDIPFILNNIEEITKEDPVSGGMIRSDYIKSIFSEEDDTEYCTLEEFHNNSGIISFAREVLNRKKGYIPETSLGYQWVNKYLELKGINTYEPEVCEYNHDTYLVLHETFSSFYVRNDFQDLCSDYSIIRLDKDSCQIIS